MLEVVLDFIYTDLLIQLPDTFMSEGGADELFDAADRYLLFSMKVGTCWQPTLHSFRNFIEICELEDGQSCDLSVQPQTLARGGSGHRTFV